MNDSLLVATGSDTSTTIPITADEPQDQLLANQSGGGDLTLPWLTAAERLRHVLALVWAELARRASEAAFLELLAEVYGGTSSDQAAFSLAASALAERVVAGDTLGLRYEIETGAEMGNAAAAYAAEGADGGPTIYINGDWLQNVSDERLRLVLLEEIGHAFDRELNGKMDTTGDEGEKFALLFRGTSLSDEELARINNDHDQTTLIIDGRSISVELSTPVLNAAVSPVLASVLEGATDPSGTTIAALIVDGSITGSSAEAIALEAVDTSLGTWQYQLNGSTEWLTIRADLINST
ncbi:MAG: hypothetical protein VKM98_09415, partial [Cyanobacteriota bacterium]|nr:hypothetical protein [Cyanobacteriota bacterium]